MEKSEMLIYGSIVVLVLVLIALAALPADKMSFVLSLVILGLTCGALFANKTGWHYKVINSAAPVGK